MLFRNKLIFNALKYKTLFNANYVIGFREWRYGIGKQQCGDPENRITLCKMNSIMIYPYLLISSCYLHFIATFIVNYIRFFSYCHFIGVKEK